MANALKKTNATEHGDSPQPKAPAPKELIAPMNSVTLAEQHNASWRMVMRDATEEDLLRPAFWSVVSSKLRSFDRIAVVTASRYFEILVTHCEPGAPVLVAIVFSTNIPIVPARARGDVPQGFRIDFDAATKTYRGVRERDEHPMTQQNSTWQGAFTELTSHAIFREGK